MTPAPDSSRGLSHHIRAFIVPHPVCPPTKYRDMWQLTCNRVCYRHGAGLRRLMIPSSVRASSPSSCLHCRSKYLTMSCTCLPCQVVCRHWCMCILQYFEMSGSEGSHDHLLHVLEPLYQGADPSGPSQRHCMQRLGRGTVSHAESL